MITKFHRQSFKDSTLVKLSVFEKYLTEWLPTFAAQQPSKTWQNIRIFDFFSGPGRDESGNEGSPLISIKTSLKYADLLKKNGHNIYFYFSDKSSNNIDRLKREIEGLQLPDNFHWTAEAFPFKKALLLQLKNMYRSANLVFADQFGIKHVDRRVFETLNEIRGTDFLFFLSSSHARRFAKTPEIQQYFSEKDIFINRSHSDTHRALCDYYRAMIPAQKKYYLAPFSLKRGPNIHGLIFGSSHYKGLLKFLRVCWEIDPERGEANFDIDNDLLPKVGESLDFFKINSKKVDAFSIEFRSQVLDGKIRTDAEAFMFTLEAGFIPSLHAKPTLKSLEEEGIIFFDEKPRLSEQCLKDPREIKLKQ